MDPTGPLGPRMRAEANMTMGWGVTKGEGWETKSQLLPSEIKEKLPGHLGGSVG